MTPGPQRTLRFGGHSSASGDSTQLRRSPTSTRSASASGPGERLPRSISTYPVAEALSSPGVAGSAAPPAIRRHQHVQMIVADNGSLMRDPPRPQGRGTPRALATAVLYQPFAAQRAGLSAACTSCAGELRAAVEPRPARTLPPVMAKHDRKLAPILEDREREPDEERVEQKGGERAHAPERSTELRGTRVPGRPLCTRRCSPMRTFAPPVPPADTSHAGAQTGA
jgi:hypothetical protein